MNTKVLFLALIITSSLHAHEQLTRFMKEHFNCGATKKELETARTADGLNVVQVLSQEACKTKDLETFQTLIEIRRSIPQESVKLLAANAQVNKAKTSTTRLYRKKPASKPDQTFKRYADITIVCVGAALFLSWFIHGFTHGSLHKSTTHNI